MDTVGTAGGVQTPYCLIRLVENGLDHGMITGELHRSNHSPILLSSDLWPVGFLPWVIPGIPSGLLVLLASARPLMLLGASTNCDELPVLILDLRALAVVPLLVRPGPDANRHSGASLRYALIAAHPSLVIG